MSAPGTKRVSVKVRFEREADVSSAIEMPKTLVLKCLDDQWRFICRTKFDLSSSQILVSS